MSSSLSSTISIHGLTQVFSSPNPQVDIVFVHGLNGHPYNTWTAENGVFWPRDLLPGQLGDVRCRILTYGYDANVSAFTDGVSKDHIHHHAENLVARLVANRSLPINNAFERPIIFVVHSLGGLVTKQCLIYSRSIEHPSTEHLRSIFVSTYGILFMGTPHNGSDLAKWGTLLQSIASAALPKKFFDSSSHLVEALKTNNETLQNINRQFNEIMPRLKIYFFYEGRPMDLKGTRQFVVDESSAAPNFQGVERMGIERDHSHMCKFENEQSTGFGVVAEALYRYSLNAPSLIAVRWAEEKQVRSFQRQMAAQELYAIDRHSRNPSPDGRPNKTPQLDNRNRAPILLENGVPTVTDWEVEEHETDASRNPSSSRLIANPLADTTNQSSPKTPPTGVFSPPPSVSQSIHERLVAPVGFRPNSHFVGFQVELARLEKKLADEKRASIGVQSALLYGLPGSGKSHLAREYLWLHFKEYPNGVFWIDCKTLESRNKCFWNVAQALGCIDEHDTHRDAFVDSVRRYLTQRDKWLMVFDGISFENEQELADFVRYIPDSRGSSIIYTTVDQTLANRQRLLDPPGIKVSPLSKKDACLLLFKSLHYRDNKKHPAKRMEKAEELVEYHDFLPLGIHAAAHMLLARGRVLERWNPGPSDNRLSEPFVQILRAMERAQLTGAIDLLMIMCFLNHQVPITLLQFGHSALTEFGLEIKSLDPNGNSGRKELDNSIAILIKNGLIERRLQTHSTSSSGGRSSPEDSRDMEFEQQPTEPADRRFKSRGTHDSDSQESSPSFIGIDILQVHTVVQNVYLDDLKARTNDKYNWWTVAVTCFLIRSWEVAYDKMKSGSGKGLMSDYREFENQVEQLLSRFPTRIEETSQALRHARLDLNRVKRMMGKEIDQNSPSQSSRISDRAVRASIFERSGSSSDEGPATPTIGFSPHSSWTLEPNVDSTSSPAEYHHTTFANLPVGINNDYHDDGGYASDTESSHQKRRMASSSTEKAVDQRSIAQRAILEGRGSLQPWRGMAVIGAVSAAEVEPFHSRSSSSSAPMMRENSSGSLAEAALSTIHRKNSNVKGNQTASPNRTERKPLLERSSNDIIGTDTRQLASVSATSPQLRQAVLSSGTGRGDVPIEHNISITRRTPAPIIVSTIPFRPSLATVESQSLPSEYSAFPMLRDLSHDSEMSVQTEPPEVSSSTKDEFVTPSASPTAEGLSPMTRSLQLPSITIPARRGRPPYPELSSPDTEPMPIVYPDAGHNNGLGVSSAQQNE